ncbi:MAG: DUF6851 domain-containing protein [Microcoleaceae cyanobacterium]
MDSQSQANSIELILNPETQLVTVNDPTPTISVQWDQVVQQAVINLKVGPTIASRAYGIVHTAMFDAWAAYDPTAIGTQLGDTLQRPISENTDANKAEAMSYAAYKVLTELFPDQVEIFDELMRELGLDPNNVTQDTTTPAGIGNASAAALLEFRVQDGSNQLGDYLDTTNYQPTNPNPEEIVNLELWTPENVPIDDLDAPLQQFLTPQWGQVTPFGLESGDALRPAAPEPFLLVEGELNFEQRTITLADGSVVAISPEIVGTVINPEFIEQSEELVEISANLTDEQKLIAEFWEDGGGTSFPPGTWITFGQFVSAQNDNTLDEDVQLFFTLGNAVFDAGIATWESKVFYDYARPVRVIRDLGELGLIGEFNPELDGFAIEAWVPGQGTQAVLATDFLTYQTPGGDPSPPFSEYTSGHSAFSGAGATILELFTGSDQFGASVTFEPGESRFEPGITPQEETTLAWETFSEAADEAGISRIYGAIHFDDGDLNGRTLGQQVGANVFKAAQFYIKGGIEQEIFVGTRDADEQIGTADDETFYGRTGNDTLVGSLGKDEIYGDDGDDALFGNQSEDTMVGGVGNDMIFGGKEDDQANGNDGNDTIFGDLGSDQVSGSAGNDTLLGGQGEDLTDGGTENDVLYGGQSNDVLFGNDGADTLFGDLGSDTLRGGLGNDLLRGDPISLLDGADTFILAIGAGTDTILDFEVGSDLIGLAEGLTFGAVTLTAENGNLNITSGTGTLAVVAGVEILTEASFSLV